MTLKVGMLHRVLEYYKVYSNGDPEMTLTYFKTRSNLVSYAFVWEKVKQWIFQKLLLVQGHSDSTFSNFFSLETARLIEVKFHVEPSLDGGTKVCSNGPDRITKMAAMPIYDKNVKKSSSLEPYG